MPTRRRRESKTELYHIIVKGINRERIFNQQREKIYFKRIILKHLNVINVEIYCYCIMSNHAHFIIRAEIHDLSRFMAFVLSEYASYYNFKHHRNGHVFQNRFTSECIEDERYFWSCLRYIHLNPVKAGMIKMPVRYRYSSMGEYAAEKAGLIHQKAILFYKNSFQDFQQFQEFHKSREDLVFQDISDEMALQQSEAALVLAEDVFKEKKLALLIQVFEEKGIRQEYIQRVKQRLKISNKKARELCELTMNKLQNE